jgi:hypothetical protein
VRDSDGISLDLDANALGVVSAAQLGDPSA